MLGKRYNNNSSKKRKHISFVFIIKVIDRSRGGFEKKNKQFLSTKQEMQEKYYIEIISRLKILKGETMKVLHSVHVCTMVCYVV